ncbi:MAG: class I SAM-dependent RNA methyltransferase, partial [bacterium]
QRTQRYFAQVADDIKEIAEEEIQSMGGAETRPVYRGIHFTATPKALYSINLCSRLLNRVLAPLVSFHCHTDAVLYKRATQVHWEDFLNCSDTFAIFANVVNSSIRHSKFAALRLKDAIVDRFRARTGQRPAIDTGNPDVWINLHIDNDEATISLDTSGGSLHRRGYRKKSVDAPMTETLAAAIIEYSGWNGGSPLYDPFCGSGTILCEAYLKASHTPAAMLRQKFGFERLPDFDAALWVQTKASCAQSISPVAKDLISGSDISLKALRSAKHNCSLLDKENALTLRQRNVFEIKELQERTIICNPPYGIRTGKNGDLQHFYKNFGDFLKQRCKGSTAFIYFGDRKFIKSIGLRTSWKRPLANGGLDGRLVKFDLY